MVFLDLRSMGTMGNVHSSSTIERFPELIDQNFGQNYCAGIYAKMTDIPLKKLIREVRKSKNKHLITSSPKK